MLIQRSASLFAITVEGETLTIHAERREEQQETYLSEFRYGSFTRSVVLPDGADTEHITATYDKGILQVTVPVPEAKPQGRRIEISKARLEAGVPPGCLNTQARVKRPGDAGKGWNLRRWPAALPRTAGLPAIEVWSAYSRCPTLR